MCVKIRLALSAAAVLLLAIALSRAPSPGQSAVPLSRPGQEDLTFFVNHNGMEDLDVLGEVGFGDMARILMRRRSNAEAFRKLRDRFVFTTTKFDAIRTPDIFRADLTANGLEWRNRPDHFIIAAGHSFNLPLIVDNTSGVPAKISAEFTGSTTSSRFPASELTINNAAGYFLRVVESQPGTVEGKLTVRAGAREISAPIGFDVRPLVSLRVEIRDEQGRPAAARLYLTGADGLAYAPFGSISRIAAMGAEYYFHAQDQFELDLPAGRTLIEATRGQEYELARQSIDLAPGKPAIVRIALKRWDNMAAKGWFSADAHIHANYTAEFQQVINLRDVRLQTYAEDLNNANMMVANSGGAFLHDAQYFAGRPNELSTRNFVLYWNEEMRNGGNYGHMCFFNLKQLVEPLYTGFRNTKYWEDYPPNYNQAETAHRQGGAVTYAHPALQPTYDGLGGAGMREIPVDLALGQVDAMDVVSNNNEIAAMELWYRLLNCGFRLAISAGTDSFTNIADHYTPGGGRVYVHSGGAGEPLRYEDWIAAYKRGRSFASNGPIVMLTVDGKEPGDDLHFPAGAHPGVRIHATLHTQAPVDRFEVVVNGKATIAKPAAGKNQLTIDEAVPLAHSSWIAARAIGPWSRMLLNDVQAFAHTSPVYVRFGDERIASKEDAQFWIDWIDRLVAQVNQRGRFATPERKREVVELFERGQAVYRGIAESAAPAK
jgi:TolB protein